MPNSGKDESSEEEGEVLVCFSLLFCEDIVLGVMSMCLITLVWFSV